MSRRCGCCRRSWQRRSRGALRRARAGAAGRGCASSASPAGCGEPGVKLAPAGITARELIEEFCGGMAPGHRFAAYLPGGASGGILPASLADLPLDFGTLDAHGLLRRLRRGGGPVRPGRPGRGGAQPACASSATKAAASARPAASAPRRRWGCCDAPRWDRALLEELAAGDGRRLDLRARPGGDEPGAARCCATSRRRSP